MRYFEDSPGSGFDFERLVFRDQLFNQRCVHWIRMFLNSSMLIHIATVKTNAIRIAELEYGDLAPLFAALSSQKKHEAHECHGYFESGK